jgi:hypothetical protein
MTEGMTTASRSSFRLRSGRTVRVDSLKQWAVYAGLLEGLPTRARNTDEIARLVADLTREDSHPPFLVQPAQRSIPHEGGYPFGEPAALPAIGCIARLHSSSPARDSSKDGSALTILWFQDDYGFPPEPAVEEAILTVGWDALAADYEL